MTFATPAARFQDYASRLSAALATTDWNKVEQLGRTLMDCLDTRRQVFICGNGGSAGNALHIVNDFFYGVTKKRGPGLRVHALPANVSVLTCLANDEGYASIYSMQLETLAQRDDVLIVLSGSGNSPNILAALETAKTIGMQSFAILGYDGGKAKAMADCALHYAVDDMQIAEDTQLIIGHMLMQWLYSEGPAAK
jgi:D-sedoheptulose 7-phosphate isomerase